MNHDLVRSVFYDDPQVVKLIEMREKAALFDRLIERFPFVKGEPGIQGDKGDQGEPGIQGLQGEMGPLGFMGDPGPRGPRGISGEVGAMGPQGVAGEKGTDATIDTAKLFTDFVKKIQKEQLLDISNIRNAASFMKSGTRYKTEELMHGGGPTLQAGSGITITNNADGTTTLSATGATISSETPSGAVDGVNTIFTVAHTPLFIIADSNFRIAGQGYTFVFPTITMDALIPPVQFIQSYFAA